MLEKRSAKIARLIPIVLLSFVAVYIICEWVFAAGGSKRIYYGHAAYYNDTVRVVDDSDFKLYEPGYSKTYTLNSSYYVSHRILLVPDSKSVPVDYDYKGEFLIEMFDGSGRPLKSTRTGNIGKIFRGKGIDADHYGNYMVYVGSQLKKAGSVYAFEIGEIPFDLLCLKWSRLKTMQVRVSVVKADERLREFCQSASLVIIPDLRL